MAVWAKIETSLRDHPKILEVGPGAAWHYICIILWCKERETDGIIPRVIADRASHAPRGRSQVTKLINARLLEEVEKDILAVHDWADYQESVETTNQRRSKAARAQRLHADKALKDRVRERDGDACRYCGVLVKWHDRRSAAGGTYDHVDPHGDNSFTNIVVACRACNSSKGDRTPEEWGRDLLRPIGSNQIGSVDQSALKEQSRAKQSRSEEKPSLSVVARVGDSREREIQKIEEVW